MQNSLRTGSCFLILLVRNLLACDTGITDQAHRNAIADTAAGDGGGDADGIFQNILTVTIIRFFKIEKDPDLLAEGVVAQVHHHFPGARGGFPVDGRERVCASVIADAAEGENILKETAAGDDISDNLFADTPHFRDLEKFRVNNQLGVLRKHQKTLLT